MSKKTVLFLLLGANGAGKTTTLQYISGLIKESTPVKSGIWGNVLTENLPIHSSKIGIAQCIEGRRIFSQLSVRENLMMGAYLCRDNAKIKRNLEYVLHYFHAC